MAAQLPARCALGCARGSSWLAHIPDDGDTQAMAEIWRVLKPGGTFHLTTNVALEPATVYVDRGVYGETSADADDGRVFFERRYSESQLSERLLKLPWMRVHTEFARQIDEGPERRFYGRVPWSYLYGGLLRWRCAENFETGGSIDLLGPEEHGAVYLVLRKPD